MDLRPETDQPASLHSGDSVSAAGNARDLFTRSDRSPAETQTLRGRLAHVVALSRRITLRVWDAQLALIEGLGLFWTRCVHAVGSVIYQVPRSLLVTLPAAIWHATGHALHLLFVTLPRDVGRVAQTLLRWLFVTLPRDLGRTAQNVLHWACVTLPCDVWRLAQKVLRWVFVTLPREVGRAAQKVLRWVFVTLPHEIWRVAQQVLR